METVKKPQLQVRISIAPALTLKYILATAARLPDFG